MADYHQHAMRPKLAPEDDDHRVIKDYPGRLNGGSALTIIRP